MKREREREREIEVEIKLASSSLMYVLNPYMSFWKSCAYTSSDILTAYSNGVAFLASSRAAFSPAHRRHLVSFA